MKIASIAHKNNEMAAITFDDGEKLIIAKELIYREGLRSGDTLSEKLFEQLLAEHRRYQVTQTAYRLLARRPHSVFELRGKLMRKKYEHTYINEVIDKLLENGYLDDLEFAKSFAAEKISLQKTGEMKVRADLQKRGVARDIIDDVLTAYESSQEYEENIRAVAAAKYDTLLKRRYDNKKIKQKLYAYLQSRGYTFDLINEIVNELVQDEESL